MRTLDSLSFMRFFGSYVTSCFMGFMNTFCSYEATLTNDFSQGVTV